MPKYRSITVSVVSHWEMKQFPEFPHPDSIQSASHGSTQSTDGAETRRSTSVSASSTSTTNTDSHMGRKPTASCYIPSIPGIRFFLKYTIEPPHPEGQLFYFKLFMNGRHINSWGVDPVKNPRGQVLRGLFEPDGKWNISKNSRTMLKQGGIESRPFLFTPEIGGKSAADDGGLIEVRIFRANGRKRRAPSLEMFRPQEQYGINLPSAGLFDKPQDARYYDYILVDPKDEPYATFLFHYRSWEFLQSLELIPPSYPRALLKPSNSFAFLARSSSNERLEQGEEMEESDSNDEDDSWCLHDDFPQHVAHVSQLHIAKKPQFIPEYPKNIDRYGEAFRSSLAFPDQSRAQTEIPISSFSVPQTTLDKWAYGRPLPRLPKATASFDHSRSSSTSSNTPSITPSLLPWLDRDSENPSPEPIIGIGIAVTLPLSDLSYLSDNSVTPLSSSSSADWSPETPPQQGQILESMPNPSTTSPNALLPPSSVVTQKWRNRNSRLISNQDRPIIEDSNNQDSDLHDQTGRIFSPLEAEWVSRKQDCSPTRSDSIRTVFTPQRKLAITDTAEKNMH